MRQISLWEADRLTMRDSAEISIASLNEYGARYPHWAIAYSGGKDSTATAAFVMWAIKSGRVTPPQTLSVLYADTRQELPPLHNNAMRFLDALAADGARTEVVLPAINQRFYVYILGTGVGWPKQRFRWCTEKIKVDPINDAMEALRADHSVLTLTGVRMGESAARDQRIAVSCSKDSGECGQGWFQQNADSLAPMLHWRVCHIWDYLAGLTPDGVDNPYVQITQNVAEIYGSDDQRTGCIACNLVGFDRPLHYIVTKPQWEHLAPLLEIEHLQDELTKAKYRLRQTGEQRLKGGGLPKNPQRLGPLTMEARVYGLERMMDIQSRADVDLINADEQSCIRQMWADNVWPQGWTGDEPRGDMVMDHIATAGGVLNIQHVLIPEATP